MKYDRPYYDCEAKDAFRKRALLVGAVFVGVATPVIFLLQALSKPLHPWGTAFAVAFSWWWARFLYRRSRDLEAAFGTVRLTPDSPWEEKHSVEWISIAGAIGLPLFFAGKAWLWP